MSEFRSSGPAPALLLILGLLAGALLFGVVRLIAMPAEAPPVHYHANWAVMIDGQRLDLTGNRYMEDVASCSADPSRQRPEDRVHMHEANQDIAHIHASGATWGHLLANIGFGLGDDYLETDQAMYQSNEEKTLKFIVNGQRHRSIRNRQIVDEERLLISYGAESEEEVIAQQFPQVAESAGEYNTQPDPASCSGHEEETLGDRVRRAFWF